MMINLIRISKQQYFTYLWKNGESFVHLMLLANDDVFHDVIYVVIVENFVSVMQMMGLLIDDEVDVDGVVDN
jgi:hypothetical protein